MSGLKATAGSPPAGLSLEAAGARGAAMKVFPVEPQSIAGFSGCATSNRGLFRLGHNQPRVLPVVPQTTAGAPVSISRSPGNGVVRGVCQQWHTRVPAWAFGSAGVRPVPREGCVVAGSSGALPRRCINPRPNCSALVWARVSSSRNQQAERGKLSRFFPRRVLSTIEGGSYRVFFPRLLLWTIEGGSYRHSVPKRVH